MIHIPATGLRKPQILAVEAIERAILGGLDRVQVSMACGSGKSRVAVEVGDRVRPADGSLVAMLAPSRPLVSQLIDTWRQHGRESRILAVSSDRDYKEMLRGTEFTTDFAEIRDWLSATSGHRTVVATYHSSAQLGCALTELGLTADVVIFDEAHHTAGPVTKMAGAGLDNSALPARTRIFFTATPVVVEAEDCVASMDDQSLYGPRVYEYSTAEAIADGYLKDFRVCVVGVPREQADLIRKSIEHLTDDRISLRTAVSQAALAKAARRYGLRKILTFHPYVDDVHEFSRTLGRTLTRLPPEQRPDLELRAYRVTGQSPAQVRKHVLAELADPRPGTWTVVSNCRIFSEGIDVPAADAVLITAPKTSTIDVVQVIGRALRRGNDGVTTATIIVPVVLLGQEHDIDEDDLPGSGWGTVWSVLRALRAHDPEFGRSLDQARQQIGATGEADIDSTSLAKLTMVVPDEVSERLLSSLTVISLRHATSRWEEGYGAAKEYWRKFGDLNVPVRHTTPTGFKLGNWIGKRRQEIKGNLLSPERKAALTDLGLVEDALEAKWIQGLAEAKKYRSQFGDLNAHRHYVSPSDFPLGSWLNTRRLERKKGKLSAKKIDELNELGMVWSPTAARWNEGIASAQEYRRTFGHLRVPKKYIDQNKFKLGTWLSTKRWERRSHRLSSEKVKALDDLGMVWEPKEEVWLEAVAELKAYKEEFGNLDFDSKYVTPSGFDLGSWRSRRRTELKGGKLAPDREAVLRDLGAI